MYVVRTDLGLKREKNEDYYLIKKIDEDIMLYVVCDGLGGYESGEVASKLCCEVIYNNILDNYSKIVNSESKEKYICDILKDSLKLANKKIYDLEKTNVKYKGMGTTVLAVLDILGKIYYMSIGDSRIYYIDRNFKNISILTEDDTYVNSLLKTNAITSEEAKVHPQKHILTKAVGVFENISCDIKKLDEKLNGYLLLCTDGVTNMIKDDGILKILRENKFDDYAIKITDKANSNGGSDNITVLVIDISKR